MLDNNYYTGSVIGNPSRLAFDRSTTRTSGKADNIDAVAEEWLLLIL